MAEINRQIILTEIPQGTLTPAFFRLGEGAVPSIGEGEVLGVKKLLGGRSFCTVSPQSRERLIVRFVVPLA